MRTVQEIFNAVIDSEHYSLAYGNASDMMCVALRFACMAGIITHKEGAVASSEIRAYLKAIEPQKAFVGSLKGALRRTGLADPGFKSRLRIYRNWDKRPMPSKGMWRALARRFKRMLGSW